MVVVVIKFVSAFLNGSVWIVLGAQRHLLVARVGRGLQREMIRLFDLGVLGHG